MHMLWWSVAVMKFLFCFVISEAAVINKDAPKNEPVPTQWLSACPTTYKNRRFAAARLFGTKEVRGLAFYLNGFEQEFTIGSCKSAVPYGNVHGLCEITKQRHLAWLLLPLSDIKSNTMCFGLTEERFSKFDRIDPTSKRTSVVLRRCLGWIELPGTCQLKYSIA